MNGKKSSLAGEVQGEEKAFIEKVIFINRVTKVTKGGKNLAFSALVVVGDGVSQVGYALGKANEVADAIRKGINRAKKRMVLVKKVKNTIPHPSYGEFGAIKILFKPALQGTGVISCAPIRAVCECCGIKDILTKNVTKSTNPINVIKATFHAFEQFKGEYVIPQTESVQEQVDENPLAEK